MAGPRTTTRVVFSNPVILAVTVAGTDPPRPGLVRRAGDHACGADFVHRGGVHARIDLRRSDPRALPPSRPAVRASTKPALSLPTACRRGRDLTPRYAEAVLEVVGAHKKLVTITKVTTGKFKVRFSSALPSGSSVKLELLRDTTPPERPDAAPDNGRPPCSRRRAVPFLP